MMIEEWGVTEVKVGRGGGRRSDLEQCTDQGP